LGDLPIIIRPIRETDRALILDSWVGILLYKCPGFSWAPKGLTSSVYRELITKLLDNRADLFRVVVSETDEDQIFGWVCGDARVTHFVWVKKEFRDMGLASTLIDIKRKGNGWVFSHWSRDCERIGRIDYKPSLFQEVIRGIESKAMGRSIAENDKHAGEGGADSQDRRDGQACREAVGMVS
jgi:hypothetical protein